jgi:myo-inositol-1-phosphate synthase
MLYNKLRVKSPNVEIKDDVIKSKYEYATTRMTKGSSENEWVVEPTKEMFEFTLKQKVPKMGLMLVGLGGNNGSTVAAGIIANREQITWETKEGMLSPKVAHVNPP